MKHKYLHNTFLAIVLFIACAVCLICRTFAPLGVLPKLDIPNMVLLSLVAMVAQQYLLPGKRACDHWSALLAALSFGILPLLSGFVALAEVWKFALIGGAVFFAVSWIYTDLLERLSTGPMAKLAPIFTAFGLYLAAQCFAGILL